MTTSVPFVLGAYLGNPSTDPAAEAQFDSQYTDFSATLGAKPQLLDAYVDYYKSIDQWVSNASYQAYCNQMSVDAKGMTPVIGLPMQSLASGSLTPDQYFKNFVSGQYDSIIQGVVKVWADDGFKTQDWRPGWEMNLQGQTYAGSDAASQADWVAAFQHIYTVLHAAGAADGVNISVVWNPGTTNYSNAEATTNLYPGNSYVDVIGADVYSDAFPYGSTTALYDWDKSGQVYNSAHPVYDTSMAQWAADPINLTHYYTNPASTQYAADGSTGHSLSLQNLIDFATANNKPIAVVETGAGSVGDGGNVSDNPTFVKWLSDTLQASTAKVDYVNIWDSNGGGTFEFSQPGDNKPLEAAAWGKYFGATTAAAPPSGASTTAATAGTSAAPAIVTLGSGSDTLALSISEDAWQGDAQFTIAVDGIQVGGTQTTTASQALRQSQVFDVMGTYAAGRHSVAVNFLNDAFGGNASMDRNLYVTGAKIDGAAVANSSLTLLSAGSQSVSFASLNAAPPAPITLGSGTDILALAISEDAWQGDAQFTVTVDGLQIGGTQTATALHAGGQSQLFDVRGNFGSAKHAVAVNFLNDAYGWSPTADRNLYVGSGTIDGAAITNSGLTLLSSGAQGFSFANLSATTIDTLDLKVSEDAWQGDAQFVVSVDGNQVGGIYTATASHAAGATQDLSLSGLWGPGQHNVGVTFINDAYGGSPSTDRNLYVNQASYDGATASGAPATLMSNGTATVNVAATLPPTIVTMHLAEDAWQGDARYAITIDGQPLVTNGTTTALHSLGQSQATDLRDVLRPGTHDLAVSFLNDLYGGSPATDRNLYVTGVDVNGTPSVGATATLFSTETTHLQITVPS